MKPDLPTNVACAQVGKHLRESSAMRQQGSLEEWNRKCPRPRRITNVLREEVKPGGSRIMKLGWNRTGSPSMNPLERVIRLEHVFELNVRPRFRLSRVPAVPSRGRPLRLARRGRARRAGSGRASALQPPRGPCGAR